LFVFNLFKREGDGINTANSPKLAKPKSRAKATPSFTRITTPKETDFKVIFLVNFCAGFFKFFETDFLVFKTFFFF
jgi:hypothetical protein